DEAGIAALNGRAEGRGLMDTVMGNLDHLSAEEERLLAARSQDSRRTGVVLLGIDVAGAVLILLLVALVMRESQRATVQLQSTLTETTAAKEVLAAAVAERTEHLVTAHDELRLSVNVLQSTFHSMAEAVLVIDADGNVLLSNPAAERMLLHRAGMNLRNLRALSDVFHGDGVTPMKADELPSVRVLRGEKFEDLEMIVRPHSGNPPRHLMISGRPMLDGQGDISGAVLVYHDATMSRETERQLYQSQKLDAIGKLTGGVAHDFNNMLTVISGNTETLVESLKQQPELQRAARLIDDAAERCAELIQHLLAFARRQPLQPRNVEINAAIADIAKLLRPTLGEQIQIETVLELGPMTAHIDPSRLTNAVLNMAINARDAMPNGGKLLLETHRAVLDEAYAQANADVVAGHYVMLAVSDTGTGMSVETQQKAFEPFFTTKEVGKGSGLGLSMVYGFVKQSGGHIKIYSEEGHGTTIKLYLPPGEGTTDVAAALAPQAEGGAETIFVVEDDNLVRNFVTAQLQSLGYRTVAAPDGKAALELIDAGEPFDLLFTDVVIPGGMSGRELAEEVARRRPGVKVLYTSGYTDNAIVHHGKLDDGVMLLTKPYRRNQLAEMIRKALGGVS
ncbi:MULTISPECIES: ATP-binding protein, partial [unclassified Bradyrhizobium]|uniref:ATP-binding protein n=1 Tax=unclassified Bradyrhizobium TaxID=2631580 RepID=UPI001FF212EE